MWVGWYSLITTPMLPKQIGYMISCMDNLGMPPTRLDGFAETMKRSQKVSTECQQHVMIVHYDLAIAKPALQIQGVESTHI